ncbi:Six-bladed beta-propeller, TolB-like [Sesbania bispinosa]|nr:Six-bladed beta-propeller, TolB-like [Sesbania bispinosa]
MAIRKIIDEGVTTITGGGKWGYTDTGHVDGPSEDAKFSNDFDVVYVGSSCSLLVVHRGNQTIREIQLHQDDCTTYDEYDNSFHLGIVVLVAADSLAIYWHYCSRGIQELLQGQKDPKGNHSHIISTSMQTDILVHGLCKKVVIPDEDEPPGIETRTPTPGKTFPFMTKELEKPQHFKPTQAYLNSPQSYYKQNCETNEIVFGAVQEHDGRREAMVIKAVDYGDPKYSHQNIRPRLNYVGYSHGYWRLVMIS